MSTYITRIQDEFEYTLEVDGLLCREKLTRGGDVIWTSQFCTVGLAHDGTLERGLRNAPRYADVMAFSLIEAARRLPLGTEIGHYTQEMPMKLLE